MNLSADSGSYCVGIDVGGTNTDAVVVKETPTIRRQVISFSKEPTTKDFLTGIKVAIQSVIKKSTLSHGITEHHISALMLGTTAFLNAIVEVSSQLSPVVVIRICGPLTRDHPPFINFPTTLKHALQAECYYVDGGFEYDRAPVVPFQEEKVKEIGQELAKKYSGRCHQLNIALTGVNASLYPDQETAASAILTATLKENGLDQFSITSSSSIGESGFLEREGATILNACLRPMARRTIQQLKEAVGLLGLNNCQNSIFLTSNYGTLLSCERAVQFPILTLNSGPVNSLCGAAQLTAVKNAIVCDVGGTTTDLAVLVNGLPRPSGAFVDLAGVRTKFRISDTLSFGLGGGSLVEFTGKECVIGPTSVGYKLFDAAKSFATSAEDEKNRVLTVTDVAIALGFEFDFGDRKVTPVKLSEEQLSMAKHKIIQMIEAGVDKMKTSKKDVPLILVGG